MATFKDLSFGVARSRLVTSSFSWHRVHNYAFVSLVTHQPLGLCLRLIGGARFAAVNKVLLSRHRCLIIDGTSGARPEGSELYHCLHVEACSEIWVCHQPLQTNGPLSPACSLATIRRKPAQQASTCDHEMLVLFMLLWWSPHRNVTNEAPVNLPRQDAIHSVLALPTV